MRKKNSKSRRSNANVSPLASHKREKKKLTPPFLQLKNVNFSSWYNQRLPNILWAALLVTTLNRDVALDLFRQILGRAQRLGKDKVPSLDHPDLATMSEETFDELFRDIFDQAEASQVLGPLAGLERLPDGAHWRRHLKLPDDFGTPLARTIAETFDHQSQASTDCRWVRVMTLLVTDRMVFNSNMEEQYHEFIEYPNRGDQRSVRPSIRAMEMGINPDAVEEKPWSSEFWRECWERTDCIIVPKDRFKGVGISAVWTEVMNLYIAVGEYAAKCEGGSEIDARHNSVFGLVMYALALSAPILRSGGHARIEGRMAIRTLVESFISLKYLLSGDRAERWVQFRNYGIGQTKLAYLKMYELEEGKLPEFVSIKSLEQYVNEDVWHELVKIDVGNWMGSDLRTIAERIGVKDIYDKYYIWPSSYVHSQWGAIREVVFDQCFNPLHRFHRVPATPNFSLISVAPDMIKLLNLHLDCLNQAYPGFRRRIRYRANPANLKPERPPRSRKSSAQAPPKE